MKEKRYLKDWVNEFRTDDRGREKRVPVYRGDWYSYGDGEKASVRLCWAGLTYLLSLLALVLYLALDFPGGRTLYIFLPTGLALFPLLYWALGIWELWKAPNPMTRVQKEKGPGRVLRSSAACVVLLTMGTVGDVVFLFAGGQTAEELQGTVLLLAAAVSALAATMHFRDVERKMKREASGI